KHELRATGTPPAADACLDAETLAAWADGGLDPASLAMAEAHASNCARCQALLGTLAQTVPAAAVPEPRTARLWRWWFAPLAATAAAATVWMVVPQGQLTAPPAPTAAESAAPEAKAQARTDREMADAPAARAEAVAPKREAQVFEARERPAEAAKVADAVAEGRVAEAAPPAAPQAALRSQIAAPDARVTARSSPSPDVIWFVGREGVVLLATDGRTFLRVPFPETVELTAVTATDERNAVVTAADGRTFQTSDGGRSWRQP
ncbi:MAG: zf-HC2 domain-containing protein, partial [Acidobacteriota bacterium]|nr:zf-HC2 domain-containing protein [Acidobacteriota bacterium]